MCTNTINGLRVNNDGSDSGNGIAIGRGRYRLTVGDIFDINDEFVFHSSLSTPSRVLVYNAHDDLLAVDSLYVSLVDLVLNHQSERRDVGYSRGSSEKDEKGSFSN